MKSKYYLITFLSIATILSSCWTRLGDVNIVSNRNYEFSKQYSELQRGVKGKGSLKRNSNQGALEVAIDDAVRKVSGGEFLSNAKIEVKTNGKKVRVIGDVWGISGYQSEKEKQNSLQESVLAAKFNIGDKVTWNYLGKYLTGTIIGKNDTKAAVRYYDVKGLELNTLIEYDKLTIIQDEPKQSETKTPNKTNETSSIEDIKPKDTQTTNSTGFYVGQIVDFDDTFKGWMEGKIIYIAPDNMLTIEYKTNNGILKTKKVAPAKVKARNN